MNCRHHGSSSYRVFQHYQNPVYRLKAQKIALKMMNSQFIIYFAKDPEPLSLPTYFIK